MSDVTSNVAASIVLNVMTNVDLALYGFRSWMLQDFDRPYEVVLSVYNDQAAKFEPLTTGANANCRVIVKTFDPPDFFNISAANNLGLHLSSGRYVLFANADIIYRGDFLRRAIWEFEHHGLCYAVAARVNLTEQMCKALKPPMEYSGSTAFDDLSKHDLAHEVTTWPAISPWMIRRDIAYAVGGFDPKVLVAEDRDIDQRVTHYLRRSDLQHSHISFCNLRGYHLHHTNTGLFDAFTQSKAIIESRQARMVADPGTTEDVMPTKLNDFDALVAEIKNTPKPPLLNRYRQDFKTRVTRRAKDVWKTILHGR